MSETNGTMVVVDVPVESMENVALAWLATQPDARRVEIEAALEDMTPDAVTAHLASLMALDNVIPDALQAVSGPDVAPVADGIDLAELDAEYARTVQALVKSDIAKGALNQQRAVLFAHAVKVRLDGNGQRKAKIKRRDCIAEILSKLPVSTVDADEITDNARYGSAMRLLFGATPATPYVCADDGACYSKASKGTLAFNRIRELCPLVAKTASDIEEQWAILPTVQADAMDLVRSIVADNLPAATIREHVATLCARHYRAVASANPGNEYASNQAAQWEKKVEKAEQKNAEREAQSDDTADQETQAETTTVHVDPPAAPEAPKQPASLTQAPESGTDSETMALQMHEFFSECDKAKRPALWVEFLELLKDDDDMDADIRADAIATLLRRANRSQPVA